MSSIPPSTRRFLARVRARCPEMYEEVITQLYLIERLLVDGGRKRQGSTDWQQLRHLAAALKLHAIQLHVREAVDLFERLCQMADDALLGLL